MSLPARVSKFEVAREQLGRLSLSEKLLLYFSHHPHDVETSASYEKPTRQWNLSNALDGLRQSFPHLEDLVKGKSVLDYGCGDGFQSVALIELGAKKVLGVEIIESRIKNARQLAQNTENVSFSSKIEGQFDVVISLNAMEHFVDPHKNLQEMKAAMTPDGTMLISFGPPWLAPYGAHMYFFCKAPWLNVLFSEQTVFKIRRLYRSDGITTYKPDLNGMTLRKFENLISELGLFVGFRQYHGIKGLDFLSKVPLAREFFVNHIDVQLSKSMASVTHETSS